MLRGLATATARGSVTVIVTRWRGSVGFTRRLARCHTSLGSRGTESDRNGETTAVMEGGREGGSR